MSQLTPAFKLTLLLSVGFHLAAVIQIGGTSTGFHRQSVQTRFNVTLESVNDKRPTKAADHQQHQVKSQSRPVPEPVRPKPGPTAKESVKPARFEITDSSSVIPNTRAQQTAGQTRTGLTNETTYRDRLLRHLEQYKHYPFVARRRQLQGEARIRLSIDQQGHLLANTCLSGQRLFCGAAIATAREAVPLPTPSKSPYQLDYVMEYQLHQ